jgi:hypothetical protein
MFFASMFLYLARSADEALAEIGRPRAVA